MESFDDRVAGIGALADPIRRELYLYVCAQPRAVGRDEAAAATAMPQHKAKFHLDRLEQEGLLEAEYARIGGRTGPGAGRTSKLYRRTRREIAVSLPERRYELAGRLMAEAISRATMNGEPVIDALARTAAEWGRRIGAAAAGTAATGAPSADATALDLARRALEAYGYEPRPAGSTRLDLVNCPFHALAQEQTELICGMNRALVGALAEEVGADRLRCVPDEDPGHCCVAVALRGAAAGEEQREGSGVPQRNADTV